MRVRLVDPHADLPLNTERGRTVLDLETPVWGADTARDLQLEPLFTAMGSQDRLFGEVGRALLLTGSDEMSTVRHRQQVLADTLRHPDHVRELYALTCDAVEDRRGVYRSVLVQRSESRLHSAVELLTLLLGRLRQLLELGARISDDLTSPGFGRFFSEVEHELDESYLQSVRSLLGELRFANGMLLSGTLGEGNEGTGFLVRSVDPRKRTWLHRVPIAGRTSGFTIPARDEASGAALSALRDNALETVSRVVNESLDHVLSMFENLRIELAFYLGCHRLHELLSAGGAQLCFPTIADEWRVTGFADPCLALIPGEQPVTNDLDLGSAPLVVLTGTNGGGKSTFLRGLGASALMARCGMFVVATSASIPLVGGVHTHFRREEDDTMRHGKFDDELIRMRRLVDDTSPGDLVLCNESFASTNELEGAQVGAAVIQGLLDAGVRVGLVTHLPALAERLGSERAAETVLLRADDTPSFRIAPGRPIGSTGADALFDSLVAHRGLASATTDTTDAPAATDT